MSNEERSPQAELLIKIIMDNMINTFNNFEEYIEKYLKSVPDGVVNILTNTLIQAVRNFTTPDTFLNMFDEVLAHLHVIKDAHLEDMKNNPEPKSVN